MVKIRAKQLISGKTPKLFVLLLFFALAAASGFALVGIAAVSLDGKTAETLFSRFGVKSVYFRAALSAAGIISGLIILAWGKKHSALTACRAAFENSFSGGIKKTFSFLIYICVKTLFSLCWAFLYLLPSAVCLLFLIISLSQGPVEKNVFTVWASGCAVLFIIGTAFLFVTLQRYSAWKYYLCLEKNGVISSLYASLEKTGGRCLEIALFKLSMLGWILSCLSVAAAVYVLPYYSVSAAYCIMKGSREKRETPKEERILPAVFRVVKEQ